MTTKLISKIKKLSFEKPTISFRMIFDLVIYEPFDEKWINKGRDRLSNIFELRGSIIEKNLGLIR